ncbi:hypothetical protein [Pseudonocardia acaciae]|uniref:hypothetical protein n=1 Tax=Pseudonocardia acaciae TaxID=551276 RepID=UPI0005671370|nr:hypothetical protein [Pseudonocardia acaciae]
MGRKSVMVGVFAFGLAVVGALGALSASAVPVDNASGPHGKDQVTSGQGNDWLAGNEWSLAPLDDNLA